MRILTVLIACVSLAACERQVGAATHPDRLPPPHSTGTAGRQSSDTATTLAGTLVSADAMTTARAAHTSTVLPDGRVLVVGGFTGTAAGVGAAELYDVAAGTFRSAGPMATNRQSHTATMLTDGRVLLAGGYDARGRYLSSAELYDPATGTFSAGGTLREARAGHVASLLPGGRVLLVGGVGEGWTFLASAEVYDPATRTFSPTGGMRAPRESHVAVPLADGRVLILGGHRGRRSDIELYSSIEIYDPAAGTFSPAGEMTVRRHKHDAVLLRDGRVLVTGGTDERDHGGRYTSAELFDPRTGTSRATTAMHLPRYKHVGTSLVLPDGRVLIAGGAEEAEVYDVGTATFMRVGGTARMPGQFSAASLLEDGRVLVTGGYGWGSRPQAGVWLYRP